MPFQSILAQTPNLARSARTLRWSDQATPFRRHPLAPLLGGGRALHENVRLVDALYVEPAEQLDATIITTDSATASAAATAELIE